MASERESDSKVGATQELLLREYEMALGALRERVRKEVAKALLNLSTALESKEELKAISKRLVRDVLKVAENLNLLTEAERVIWTESPKAYVELLHKLLLDGKMSMGELELKTKIPSSLPDNELLPSLIFKETFSALDPALSAQLARKILSALKHSSDELH